MALGLTAAWLLAVILHAVWAALGSGNYWYGRDSNKHVLAAVLPLIFGWSCFGLYRWTMRRL
jgi:hypothetical protein